MTRALLSFLVVAIAAGGNAQRQPDTAVTFTRDIAPIVFGHCASCHRPGEVGPFSLLTYADVRQRATLIAQVTAQRVMPPWKSSDERGLFVGDPSLTADQVALIQRWVEGGMPEGRPEDLPALPAVVPAAAPGSPVTETWTLGPPDLVVRMDQAYDLAATAPTGDVFRTFVLPVRVADSHFIRAVDFHPGNARVVHHANLGVDRTQASRRRDERDAEPGFAGGMLPDAGYPPGQMLGWTPGETPRPSPPGTAWRLDPGSDFIVNLHMQPTGKPERVQASVGLYYTDATPTRAPVVLRLGSRTIDIAAGDTAYTASDSYVLPVDVEVVAIQAHAHYLARRIEARAATPDGLTRNLLTIPDWDFRWQEVYRYATPIVLPRNTTIRSRFSYDNSAANPRNPNSPPRRIVWGQNTTEEMGDLWLQVIPVKTSDAALLYNDITKKMVAEDTAAFAKLVERDPENAGRREELATMYLQTGRVDDAIAQLREAVRLNPRSAPAHYNLGLALARQQQLNDAVKEFTEAVTIDPDLGEAHLNIGAILQATGRSDDALPHFRRAVELRPDSGEAHSNLGRLLAMRNDEHGAAVELERAVQLRPDLVSAVIGLTWLRASSSFSDIRNAAEAVRLGELAASLTANRDASALDALAAGYAAGGQFDRAVTTARAALAAAAATSNRTLALQIEVRLTMYEERMPYVAAKP